MSKYSGTCGKSLKWCYDDSTCELTISGTGVMEKFEIKYDKDVLVFDDRPWMLIINTIKTIVVDDGVFNISQDAFLGAESLEKVVVKGICINIDSAAFANCKNLKRVDFKYPDAENAYVKLEEGVFAYCESLEYINLPYNGELLNNVFYECHSLRSIRIPKGTTVIYDDTFSDCKNLVEVQIPNTVECIESDAFEGCDILKTVIIPKSVRKIGIFELRD